VSLLPGGVAVRWCCTGIVYSVESPRASSFLLRCAWHTIRRQSKFCLWLLGELHQRALLLRPRPFFRGAG
jgi:hypothetical protein